MLEPDHLHRTLLGEYVVQGYLGKGKSGYSYLVQREGQDFVLKIMHDDPVPYYTFHDNKVTLEVAAYHRLRELDVAVPELIESDPERRFLVKTFVSGEVAMHAIAQQLLTDEDILRLRRLSARLRAQGHNIDWFPTNFVLGPQGVTYIDYEINAYHQEWSFEDWGVWYWADAEGMRAYLETGDILHLNADADSGKPRQNGETRSRIAAWLGLSEVHESQS